MVLQIKQKRNQLILLSGLVILLLGSLGVATFFVLEGKDSNKNNLSMKHMATDCLDYSYMSNEGSVTIGNLYTDAECPAIIQSGLIEKTINKTMPIQIEYSYCTGKKSICSHGMDGDSSIKNIDTTFDLEGKNIVGHYNDGSCCYISGSYQYMRSYHFTLEDMSVLTITAGIYLKNANTDNSEVMFYRGINSTVQEALNGLKIKPVSMSK